MDERIEKAFDVANYMATLSNQRRIILEELDQKLIYYINGATFKIDANLISFTKTVLDIGHETDVAFLDSNKLPIIISDVREFFENITSVYFEAINEYAVKYADLSKKRRISDIVEL